MVTANWNDIGNKVFKVGVKDIIGWWNDSRDYDMLTDNEKLMLIYLCDFEVGVEKIERAKLLWMEFSENKKNMSEEEVSKFIGDILMLDNPGEFVEFYTISDEKKIYGDGSPIAPFATVDDIIKEIPTDRLVKSINNLKGIKC